MTALAWAVKASLVGYVERMPDGRIELDGATRTDAGFIFPVVDADAGRFTGSVTFLGHNGMMRVVIADPWVTRDGGGAVLSIADPDDPRARLDFARSASFDGRIATATTLTADGADLFFGPYTAGTPLDDPHIID